MDSTELSDDRPRFSWSRVILALLPLLGALAVATGYLLLANRWEVQASLEKEGLTRFGLATPTVNHLANRYRDTDGDLVADPPADPAQWADPERLTFSYIVAEDADEQAGRWRVFLDHLAEQTGREVEYRAVKNTDDQLRALRDGELHIAGLNTGAVPKGVNASGFVPIATLGRTDGSFGYQMQIIVPADSPIQQIEDLKNRQLTFTTRNSNSGFKAPVVLLKTEFNLLPDRDYAWGFSHSHAESILRVAAADLDAAAVASDMVARTVAAGEIDNDAIRAIYSSERFPPAALGYAHNLKPELAAKISAAILAFQFSGTPLEEEFAGNEVTQFVPVSYQEDWAIIRRVDDALGTVHAAE